MKSVLFFRFKPHLKGLHGWSYRWRRRRLIVYQLCDARAEINVFICMLASCRGAYVTWAAWHSLLFFASRQTNVLCLCDYMRLHCQQHGACNINMNALFLFFYVSVAMWMASHFSLDLRLSECIKYVFVVDFIQKNGTWHMNVTCHLFLDQFARWPGWIVVGTRSFNHSKSTFQFHCAGCETDHQRSQKRKCLSFCYAQCFTFDGLFIAEETKNKDRKFGAFREVIVFCSAFGIKAMLQLTRCSFRA